MTSSELSSSPWQVRRKLEQPLRSHRMEPVLRTRELQLHMELVRRMLERHRMAHRTRS